MAYRHWCFTDFTLTLLAKHATLGLPSHVNYLVGQREKCPETGKIHDQCYVELAKPMRMKQVQELVGWPNETHFESRKGTRDQARDYCMDADKRLAIEGYDSGPWELGKRKGQGRRTDIEEFVQYIQEKRPRTVLEAARANPLVALRYPRGLQMLQEAFQEDLPARQGTTTIVLFGQPGCGKSTGARYQSQLMNLSLYALPLHNALTATVWFDGYDNQETLLIDDYSGQIPYGLLLQLTDQFPMRVPVKGGFRPFFATRIYIISNKRPTEWHPNQNYEALSRRVTWMYECTKEKWTCVDAYTLQTRGIYGQSAALTTDEVLPDPEKTPEFYWPINE